jgi:hypothetical protein
VGEAAGGGAVAAGVITVGLVADGAGVGLEPSQVVVSEALVGVGRGERADAAAGVGVADGAAVGVVLDAPQSGRVGRFFLPTVCIRIVPRGQKSVAHPT